MRPLLRRNFAQAVTAVWGLLSLAACNGGGAPRLDPIDDQVATVGAQLSVVIHASQADGQQVVFSYDAPDLQMGTNVSIAAYGTDGSQAMFRFTPRAADVGMHVIDFHATSGSATATESVGIQVLPAMEGKGGPEFVAPLGSGTELDVAAGPCLDVAVEIKATGATKVTIAEAEPRIAGGVLTATGGFTATWHWCPTAAQIAAADPYTLKLTASDGKTA